MRGCRRNRGIYHKEKLVKQSSADIGKEPYVSHSPTKSRNVFGIVSVVVYSNLQYIMSNYVQKDRRAD